MYWSHQSWLWAEILPVFAVLAAAVAHFLRGRRMKRFGETKVLGTSAHPIRHIAGAVLVAAGVACAAAVPAGPRWRRSDSPTEPGLTQIILDFKCEGDSGQEAQDLWDDLCDQIDLLLSQALSPRFSLRGVANASDLEIPDTFDRLGLLLILTGHTPDCSRRIPANLQDVEESLSSQSGEHQRRIVVSTRSREALSPLQIPADTDGEKPLVIRIAGETHSAEWAVVPVNGEWTWGREQQILRRHLSPAVADDQRRQPLWKRLSAVQLLALAGFIFLSVDALLPILGKLGKGRHDLG